MKINESCDDTHLVDIILSVEDVENETIVIPINEESFIIAVF